MELVKAACDLNSRLVRQFQVARSRVKSAGIAKPDEFRYSIDEIERLKRERRQKALDENETDMEKLKAEVSAACVELRREADKKLRPLQNSTSVFDRDTGEHAETKAFRYVSVIGYVPETMRREYERAVSVREVDLATEILSWWRVVHGERMNTIDIANFEKLESDHLARTGAKEILDSVRVLEKRLAVLMEGNPFEDGNITRQILLGKDDPELAGLLRGEGESVTYP